MNKQPSKIPPCGHILHSDYVFHVLVSYEPRKGEPNHVGVMCEPLPEGDSIVAFLSPINAMIDAAYAAKPPTKFYQHIPIQTFDPREFINDYDGTLRFAFHCGYAAYEEKIAIRKNGGLGGMVLLQTEVIQKNDINSIDFKVDGEILEAIKRTYGYAGLFAYQETFTHVGRWTEQRCQQEVYAAIQTVGTTVDPSVEFNQIAIYDPEFRQWHFVPLEILEVFDGGSK